jgi:hypothetical protein
MSILCVKDSCPYYKESLTDSTVSLCLLRNNVMKRKSLAQCEIETIISTREASLRELKLALVEIQIAQKGRPTPKHK